MTEQVSTINLSALLPVEHDLLLCERFRLRADAKYRHLQSSSQILYRYGIRVWVENESGRKESVLVAPDTNPLPTTIDQVVPWKIAHALTFASEAEVAQHQAVTDILDEANALVAECHAEYDSRPWNRYYLVTSSDGHIHRSTYCSSCNKGKEATGFALVPFLSGSDDATAVGELGSALCSICFADAPSESKEQIRISGRVALVLAERGVEAFQLALGKARKDATKRASDRCEGSGSRVEASSIGRFYKCPVCGNGQRQDGKVRAHRRPRWFAVKENWNGFNDGWWDGAKWAPSTKKVDLGTKENAEAVVAEQGGTRTRCE
jgi:hypothetical protein